MINLSGIQSAATNVLHKVGTKAYTGAHIATTIARGEKDAFMKSMKETANSGLADKAKAIWKNCTSKIGKIDFNGVIEKAGKNFKNNGNIRKKTYIGLGIAAAAIGAGIVSLINKATHKNAVPAENQQ